MSPLRFLASLVGGFAVAAGGFHLARRAAGALEAPESSRLVLELLGAYGGAVLGVHLVNALADFPEASPTIARRVELQERIAQLEAELEGVRVVRVPPVPKSSAAAELPALPFGPPSEPAKA